LPGVGAEQVIHGGDLRHRWTVVLRHEVAVLCRQVSRPRMTRVTTDRPGSCEASLATSPPQKPAGGSTTCCVVGCGDHCSADSHNLRYQCVRVSVGDNARRCAATLSPRARHHPRRLTSRDSRRLPLIWVCGGILLMPRDSTTWTKYDHAPQPGPGFTVRAAPQSPQLGRSPAVGQVLRSGWPTRA
jgi:hypothetical protein